MVVPAYDAGRTLGATLDSLQRQTLSAWEAIVVDDGSRDGTAALVEERARSEQRLRLVRQGNRGVSAARNAGIAAAAGRWLVFLDADDWLVPEALATLREALRAQPELDAVHCGWTRIAPDGREVDEICPRSDEDMLAWHVHNCAFAIHAVMVRRDLVERAGGFDPGLTTCEDWDLWLRLSRLGTRWGRVDAQLAYYRIRARSASMASRQLLQDGLEVIERAHRPDARLGAAAGDSRERLEANARTSPPDGRLGTGAADVRDRAAAGRARARLVHAAYSAGLALAQGEDAVALLAAVADDRCEELGSDELAYALFEAVPLGAGTIPADWSSFPAELVDQVDRVLDELERISGAPRLALRTRRSLERLVAQTGSPLALLGRIERAAIDLERRLVDVVVAADVERLLVEPSYGELELPAIELPACDGHVPAELIADAIAAEHAWALLGTFFDANLAPRLAHDDGGWELLLQELCGDAETGNAAFYDPAFDADLAPVGRGRVEGGWAAVELSAPLPELLHDGPLRVVASVGGATLGTVAVEPVDGRVAAGALRREICTQAGFELCRLAVREGLLGHPLVDGSTLRARLSEAAERRSGPAVVSAAKATTAVPATAATAVSRAPRSPVAAALSSPAPAPLSATGPAGLSLAPGWERHAARALNGDPGVYVIARRRAAATGLSGSRVALVPRSAGAEAVAAARAAGEPVIAIGAPGPDAPVVYAPDIVWHESVGEGRIGNTPAGHTNGTAPSTNGAVSSALVNGAAPPGPGRAFFEALFAAGADPWTYTSEYEQGKYQQTLSLLGEERPRRALELGCAEGHFTRQLAPRVDELRAYDISAIALERARRRCADLAHVRFDYHDLFSEPVDGRYDLIVCSEVLYYAGDRARLEHAARAIADALEPGGRLLAAHANLVVDAPGAPGFDWEVPFGARTIGEAFAAAGLELERELANPLYRLQAYAHPGPSRRFRRRRPARDEAQLPVVLPREVEQRFLWRGGEPAGPVEGQPVTWELPILMYHRVASQGSERLREWRVTPDQLERQLHYLRTAGYRAASFEQWREATEHHRPLPGRRVMLTFDDGYEDFAEHAYPLLRQYELEATVFLVSEQVGLVNEWDRSYGETVPLMDWDTIRALDGQGVSFGGHSASHPMLTGLGLDEVVREASRCRATLVEQLGHLVRPFAYPYGDVDAAVARTVGACGFEFAVTTAGVRAGASAPMLSLPRMNVSGTGSFDDFVRMLTPFDYDGGA